MPTLSVVVITKNQAWNIRRLIDSILLEVPQGSEVLVVDSNSSDDTTARACEFPVRVLCLHPDQRLTPAAGRYVGCKESVGEYVLFLDGDMELREGSVAELLRILEGDPTIAAVCGLRLDLPKSAERPRESRTCNAQPAKRDIAHSGGASLFRRSALAEAGGFNPFLFSDEEPELCLRVRALGKRIVEVALPFVYHYTDEPDAIRTRVARARRNLYLGAGQAIRYHLRDGLLWPYVKERGFGLVPGLALVGCAVLIAGGLASGRYMLVGAALSLGLMGAVLICIRKGGIVSGLSSLALRLLILDGTARGFLLKPFPIEDYPGRFDVIQ